MKLFGDRLKRLRNGLVQADELQRADLIFVLAGHRNRKVYGARLFRDLWAPSMVMSTGDPPYIAKVLVREVPKSVLPNAQIWTQIEEAASLPSPRGGQFFACLAATGWSVEPIRVEWLGTLSEIKALARWLQRCPATRSLLIVSAGTHLKRLRMCCLRLLPKECETRFIAVPQEDFGAKFGGKPQREGLRPILLEWTKVVLYGFLLTFTPQR